MEIGRPRKYLFPTNSPQSAEMVIKKDDIPKAKEFMENNREWKKIGDSYELIEDKMNIVHKYHPNGISLNYFHMKQNRTPKGVVVLFHGFTSAQSIETGKLANIFGPAGFEVIGFDQESHGRNVEEKSERCLIHDYRGMIANSWGFIEKFFDNEKERIDIDEIPLFFWGQSMGGSTVISLLLQEDYLRKFPVAGASIFCPALENIQEPGIFAYCALIAIAYFKPDFGFGPGREGKVHVSNFEFNLKQFLDHPDSYDGKIKIATGREILRLGYYVLKNLWKMRTPFCLFFGDKDNLCKFNCGKKVFEQTKLVKDKVFVRCKGMMHALTTDHCSLEVCTDTFHWINIRANEFKKEIKEEIEGEDL